MNAIRSLLKFLYHAVFSRSLHGTHSPFVYELLKEAVYKKTQASELKAIESIRKKLLRNREAIRITDMGAGSGARRKEIRYSTIRQIARKALKAPFLARLLYRLVAYLKPRTVIELGTSLGITTAYLATASPVSNIITIEGSEHIVNVAKKTFERLKIKNVRSVVGNFDEQLPLLLKELGTVDFVFIDGNHTYESTMNYFEWLLPAIHANSVLIFDDIYWSKDMERAWKEIKNHSMVSVSMDFFYLGLVFFRSGQAAQNFRIWI